MLHASSIGLIPRLCKNSTISASPKISAMVIGVHLHDVNRDLGFPPAETKFLSLLTSPLVTKSPMVQGKVCCKLDLSSCRGVDNLRPFVAFMIAP